MCVVTKKTTLHLHCMAVVIQCCFSFSIFLSNKPYYKKQSEPVPLMFDISVREISFGNKEASLFIAWMCACGWKPYCMSLHNRLCRLCTR